MGWTDKQKDELRKLWCDRDNGLSAHQMGAMLGQTKNAVIGMAHRMCLPQRGLVKLKNVVRRKRRSPKPIGAAVSPIFIVNDEPSPALPPETHPEPGQCKYMHGDPREPGWQFCGARTYSVRKPYCDYHSAKLLTPNEIGKRKP